MNRLAIAIALLSCASLSVTANAVAQKYLFNKLELPTVNSPESVAVGDFNRDGFPDFVVVNNADATIGAISAKRMGLSRHLRRSRRAPRPRPRQWSLPISMGTANPTWPSP
jgi:hypothetical protein